MNEYLTLKNENCDEFTVKHSRFIGYAKPVTTQDEAVKFIKKQSIYASIDLPYTSQLIPLSVLFALNKDLWYPENNRIKLEQWYWCGVFGELYGGANESRFALDIAGMMKWAQEEDTEYRPDTFIRSNFHYTRLQQLYTRNSAAYKGVMALILKNNATDFISGEQ